MSDNRLTSQQKKKDTNGLIKYISATQILREITLREFKKQIRNNPLKQNFRGAKIVKIAAFDIGIQITIHFIH